jgi:hypothetical protein
VRRLGLSLAAAGFLLLLVGASTASAHSLGGSPVETRIAFPAWIVWITGAVVVAISFAVVAGFLSGELAGEAAAPAGAGPMRGGRAVLGQTLGLVVLALVLGNAIPGAGLSRLPSTAVGPLLSVLLPLLAMAVGNFWPWVSPFRPLGRLADELRFGRRPLRYPDRLGAWPAVSVILILTTLEASRALGSLVGPAIALGCAAYVAFTTIAMVLFGADTWLARAEGFSIIFRWWGAFPGLLTGTLAPEARDAGEVAAVVALLFGVNFDGFLSTPWGQAILRAIAAPTSPAFAVGILLLCGFAFFLAAFQLCVRGIRAASESEEPPRALAPRFVASLVPIAVAYNLAHNLPALYQDSPRFLLAAADPFGLGWSPRILASVPPLLFIPNAWVVWIAALQVVVILAGHVLAVAVAHKLSFRAFPSRIQAIVSEAPLTAAMVTYTLVGLAILSTAAGGV